MTPFFTNKQLEASEGLKSLVKAYPAPRLMPTSQLDEEGIYVTDYGKIFLTPAHAVHALNKRLKMCGYRRLPIMLCFEAGSNAQNSMKTVSLLRENIETTQALALVTTSKIGEVIGNVYLSITAHPFPVKLFSCREKARTWLKSHMG